MVCLSPVGYGIVVVLLICSTLGTKIVDKSFQVPPSKKLIRTLLFEKQDIQVSTKEFYM